MYEDYFHLQARPFENTPDPSFFFMEGQYRDALAVLKYQVMYQKGITVVVGPSGCGKTTLGNVLLSHLPEGTQIVYIVFLRADPVELLDYVAKELGAAHEGLSTLELVKSIRDRALRIHSQGGRCFLVLDEAQYMDEELLGEIQLLSNLETTQAKLIQILLLGRKELLGRLGQPRLDALRQRIAVIKELGPMNEVAVAAYIRQRLKVAGGAPDLFTPEAVVQVARISNGYPRNINKICDMSLLKAFISGKTQVGLDRIFEASAELGFTFSRPQVQVRPRSASPPPVSSNQQAVSPAAQTKIAESAATEAPAAPSTIPEQPPSQQRLASKPQEPGIPQVQAPEPDTTSTEDDLGISALPGLAPTKRRSSRVLWLLLLVVILAAVLNWNYGLVSEWAPSEWLASKLGDFKQPVQPVTAVHKQVEPEPAQPGAPVQTPGTRQPGDDQATPQDASTPAVAPAPAPTLAPGDSPPSTPRESPSEEVDTVVPATAPETTPAPLPPWAVNVPEGSVIITMDKPTAKAKLWRCGTDGIPGGRGPGMGRS